MTNNKDINWAIFLKHMRIVGRELRADFQKDLKEAISPLKEDMTIIKQRLERLEQDVFILVAHRKANEQRLDTIENVKLPKINKSIRNMQKRFRSDKKQKPRSTVQA